MNFPRLDARGDRRRPHRPQKHVERARIALAAAERGPVQPTPARLEVGRPMIWRWQQLVAYAAPLGVGLAILVLTRSAVVRLVVAVAFPGYRLVLGASRIGGADGFWQQVFAAIGSVAVGVARADAADDADHSACTAHVPRDQNIAATLNRLPGLNPLMNVCNGGPDVLYQ